VIEVFESLGKDCLMKRFIVFAVTFALVTAGVFGGGVTLPGSGTEAATIYVDNDAQNDPAANNTSTSDPLEDGKPEHPFDSIQEAIDAAIDGDTVIIQDGTYTGPGNRDIDFLGKAITVRSAAPNDPNSYVIDCQGTGADEHTGFYFRNQEASDSRLEGITIINGFGSSGGAVYLAESSPTISNCIIRNNSCTGSGSGIYCYSPFWGGEKCKPTISNCIIVENSDGSSGGAIHGCYGEITHSVISGNTNAGIIYGAGMIIDCEISNNRGSGLAGYDGTIEYSRIHSNQGGGLGGCDGIISHCEIYNNTNGGGLRGCDGTIEYCKIFDNEADHGGGLAYCEGLITGCEIIGNTANVQGGGVLNCHELRNSIVAFNTSGQGAGVQTGYGLISNCTICFNEAAEYCGGIQNGSMSPTLRVENTIVRNNLPVEIYMGDEARWPVPFTYCNIKGGWEGEGNIDMDPLYVDELSRNLRILPISPCINAGDPNYIQLENEKDADGEDRVAQGRIDIGADECSGQGTYMHLTDRELFIEGYKNFSSYAEHDLGVTLAGEGEIHWKIEAKTPCDWLEILPDSGISSGETDKVTLKFDISQQEYGVYSMELIATAQECENSPLNISIQLCVLPGEGLWVPHQYPTIQDAVDAAQEGQVVVVSDGTYTGEGNSNVRIEKSITVRSENGPEKCIIDCESSVPGFYIRGNDSILDGFTIQNGYSNVNGGGIIIAQDTNTVIRNCIVKDCKAKRYGGGIACSYVNYGSGKCYPKIENCQITGNEAIDCSGGGISRCYGTISSTVISKNKGYLGGGIYKCGDITGCTIQGNYAAKTGGGVSESYGMFVNCTIDNNEAGESGGGLDDCGKIVSSVISNNNSQYGGGAVDCLSFSNCLIINNTAEVNGGGLLTNNDDMILNNCTVYGNVAAYGGGAYVMRHELTAQNSIFRGNSPEAIYLKEYAPGKFTTAYASYCNIKGGFEGEGNIDIEPMFVDAANGDFRLMAGSPCINAGENTLVPADIADLDSDGNTDEVVPYDFRGWLRIRGGYVDMGAYEFLPVLVSSWSVVSKNRIDRSKYEYECEIDVTNISGADLYNVSLELVDGLGQLVISDPDVGLGDVLSGQTVTSTDTFTITIDRNDLAELDSLYWKVSFAVSAEASLEMQSIMVPADFGVVDYDFDDSGAVDVGDLAVLASQWLESGICDVTGAGGQPDGVVNLLDFAAFAKEF